MPDECYKKSERLSSYDDIHNAIYTGVKVTGPSIAIYILKKKDPQCPSRLGIIINRKQGNAVFRNRFKRLVRESFRKIKYLFSFPLDMVVVALNTGALRTRRPIEAEMKDLLKRRDAINLS